MANQHGAINLAQGFPDFEGPEWALELARKALFDGKNQYAPSYGLLPLREKIAANYQTRYGLKYDPATEVLVTNGATEAIYAVVTALVAPGDEVVAFEPLYDSYLASVRLAGGELRAVTLTSPDFTFSLDDLKARITPKTKLLILNNPHNPTGRVFTRAELAAIADLAVSRDFYILSDEVYEYLSFEQDHLPVATFAGLRDRVLTTSSIGKTLSLTGWKVGWVVGPAALIDAVHRVHQFVTFCVATPLQAAVAEAWDRFDQYIPEFADEYAERREILTEGLRARGFDVLQPQGTYFGLVRAPSGQNGDQFAEWLIKEKRVAALPIASFYLDSDDGRGLVRFCFAKKAETLRTALERLGGVK